MLNRVTIAGNLGAVPTIRTTADGTTVANFRLATNEFMGRDANGSPKYHTEWHSIVCWGPLAEAVARRLEKGNAIYVEGALRTRAYEDKNGEQRRVTEIKASKIQFLDPREIDAPGQMSAGSTSITPRHRRRHIQTGHRTAQFPQWGCAIGVCVRTPYNAWACCS